MLRNNKGVSIVEIMVALAVMGIGIMAAMRTLPESSAKTTRSRNRTIAVNLAQAKLEDLMARNFVDADLTAGTHDDPNNPIRPHFNRSWEVTDNTPAPGMKRISVKVTFDTASADSEAVLQTFKTVKQ